MVSNLYCWSNSFEDKSKITISQVTTKSTQPEALEILLKLKNYGAKVYYTTCLQEKPLNLMDLNYLIKLFSIVGSSNMSSTALRDGNELNIEDNSVSYESFALNSSIIEDPNTKTLSDLIEQYKNVYESENMFIKNTDFTDEIRPIIQRTKPVQKDALRY